MIWPFRRKSSESDTMDVDVLLARANTAQPGTFRMPVDDVFSITGRGTVVTGKVEAGVVAVDQQVRILRAEREVARTRVTGVEAFREVKESATVGENVGLLLDGIEQHQVFAGDVIAD